MTMYRKKNKGLGAFIQQAIEAESSMTIDDASRYSVSAYQPTAQAQTRIHTETQPLQAPPPFSAGVRPGTTVRRGGGSSPSTEKQPAGDPVPDPPPPTSPDTGRGGYAPIIPPSADPAPVVPPVTNGGEGLSPNGGSNALPADSGVYDDTPEWLRKLKTAGREFIDPRGKVAGVPSWGWWILIAVGVGGIWYWRVR